jgi:hypothetical protein
MGCGRLTLTAAARRFDSSHSVLETLEVALLDLRSLMKMEQ